jgi:hypothetical protein
LKDDDEINNYTFDYEFKPMSAMCLPDAFEKKYDYYNYIAKDKAIYYSNGNVREIDNYDSVITTDKTNGYFFIYKIEKKITKTEPKVKPPVTEDIQVFLRDKDGRK